MSYLEWAQKHLQKVSSKPDGKGYHKSLCPLHEEDSPSFSFHAEGGFARCFGCGWGNPKGHLSKLAKELGLPTTGMPDKPRPGRPKAGREVDFETVFFDLDGETPLVKEIRYRPKDFSQCRYEAGKWIDDMGDVPWPLLHADRIHKADPSTPVFVVEGCKAASHGASMGLLTTTNPCGSGKFDKVADRFLELLRGRTAIVLPDNDQPGEKHAQQVVRVLTAFGCTCKILRLEGLKPKGDLVDWAAVRGHSKEVLLSLAQAAPVALPEPPRGTIVVNDRSLQEKTTEALRALDTVNHPPWLFASEGQIVRFVTEGVKRPQLQSLDRNSLKGVLARAADWVVIKTSKMGDWEVSVHPDNDVVTDILSLPAWPLPAVDYVVETPVFSHDGTLLETPGHHPSDNIIYHPVPGLEVPEVPFEPSSDDVAAARNMLLVEMMGEFPFVDDASRAHAVALALGPFARNLFPLAAFTMVEAPNAGTGKGLLVDALMSPSVGMAVHGRSLETLTEGKDDGDWRVRITSALRNRPVFIQLDNLNRRIDSGSLAAALTMTLWNDRELGVSRTISVPNRAIWFATANNPRMSNEISRRCVSIRMDARCDQPWTRDFAKDLGRWAEANRAQLIWSCLVLIRNWVARGQPLGTVRLGSYQRWADVMGGILEAAGIPGFMANAQEMYARADEESGEWREFVSCWAENFMFRPVTVKELFAMVEENDLLNSLSGKSESGQRKALGVRLSKQVDRMFGPYKICKGGSKHDNNRAYRLSYEGKSPLTIATEMEGKYVEMPF